MKIRWLFCFLQPLFPRAYSEWDGISFMRSSKKRLPGDCTLTSLTNNGTINFNGHTITLADGTILK